MTPSYRPSGYDFIAVRYFTQNDIYHYTVDNRPVTDVFTNVQTLEAATDAARRSVIMETIGGSAFQSALVGNIDVTVGLTLDHISGSTFQLNRGAFFQANAIASDVSSEIMKAGTLATPRTLLIDSPEEEGNEVPTLVQIRNVSYGSGDSVPYEDTANAFVASTMVTEKIEVSLVKGVEAPEGTSWEPSPTSGWTPLYVVRVTSTGNVDIQNSSGRPLFLDRTLLQMAQDISTLQEQVAELQNAVNPV